MGTGQVYRVRDPEINLCVSINLVSWSGCALRVFMAWCVSHGRNWCVTVTFVIVCNSPRPLWQVLFPKWPRIANACPHVGYVVIVATCF